jgi:hypothetical protein
LSNLIFKLHITLTFIEGMVCINKSTYVYRVGHPKWMLPNMKVRWKIVNGNHSDRHISLSPYTFFYIPFRFVFDNFFLIVFLFQKSSNKDLEA